tara:strand:+ start:318 stop:791 length:474 start_codon:yes stop_codon:yes gene_type:complete
MIKVVNNFLHENDFNNLVQEVLKSNFFYHSSVAGDNTNDGYYFTHKIYENDEIRSSLFNLIKPVLEKINAKAIVRAKVNLFPSRENLIEYGQHMDTDFKCKTFLLSLNTCNGFTRIGKDKTIPSVENTGIYFPSNILHNSTNCTDADIRLNININYF